MTFTGYNVPLSRVPLSRRSPESIFGDPLRATLHYNPFKVALIRGEMRLSDVSCMQWEDRVRQYLRKIKKTKTKSSNTIFSLARGNMRYLPSVRLTSPSRWVSTFGLFAEPLRLSRDRLERMAESLIRPDIFIWLIIEEIIYRRDNTQCWLGVNYRHWLPATLWSWHHDDQARTAFPALRRNNERHNALDQSRLSSMFFFTIKFIWQLNHRSEQTTEDPWTRQKYHKNITLHLIRLQPIRLQVRDISLRIQCQ